jgi:hypothetical protein
MEARELEGAACEECGASAEYEGAEAEALAEMWAKAHSLVTGHRGIERWLACRVVLAD